jgi:hypothetical protein
VGSLETGFPAAGGSASLPAMARRSLTWVLVVAALAGCGRRKSPTPGTTTITLRELDSLRDTTGLSRGAPLLEHMEPYRMANGAIRVRGNLDLPAGTVLQIAVSRAGERWPFTRIQFALDGRHFDSPPILGPRGPLPTGTYRFELVTRFDSSWQTAEVLRASDDGRDLRGPGVTRDLEGHAAFVHVEERRL